MNNPRVTHTIRKWGTNGAWKATVSVDGKSVVMSYHPLRKDAEAWREKEVAWRSQKLEK